MIERLLEAERDLAVGLVDTAEAIYRGLAEVDPQNAVAVVGLARCALEHGDERGAYRLAVRALAIDPEDAAALRMEARLSEVFATRGEPVERPAFVQPGEQPSGVAAATRTDRENERVPQPAPKPGLLRRMLGRR
ncbi:MAG TPA: tetratricopeptide repeat protein [Candidatus Acidoferrales bacterium]|nr:tetratricopeptide repeat protein [Candidatus Acidoferrales bacterium]